MNARHPDARVRTVWPEPPDGTEAWADDYLFPESSYSEGTPLARQVLKWLGGGE